MDVVLLTGESAVFVEGIFVGFCIGVIVATIIGIHVMRNG